MFTNIYYISRFKNVWKAVFVKYLQVHHRSTVMWLYKNSAVSLSRQLNK